MDLVFVLIIFLIIVILMRFGRKLQEAMSIAIFVGLILFRVPVKDGVRIILKGAFSMSTIYLLLAFYSITFLQRMMEKRGLLILAEKSLIELFHSRRINAMFAPFTIGLLPSPGAVLIAAPIVNNAAGDFLDREEKTFVTTYYRHISEAFVPTYASILLALQLSGVNMTAFVVLMLPLVAALFWLGYIFYVKKIPKNKKVENDGSKIKYIKNLFYSIWPILLAIILILSLKTQVVIAVIPVIIIAVYIYKFDFKELLPFFKTAFEPNIMLTTIVIMILKELLSYTGVIVKLPELFANFSIHPTIIYAIIFFIGTIIAGSKTMVAIIIPLAFASSLNAGVGELVLYMAISYIAMQISPTHICLAIILEENKTSFSSLIAKTMPVLISFIAITIFYSYILIKVF
ncbi:MAG: DUF401 family protein [Tissierellia bacterium]|nr:DUF401 family protein [Tissierellia bacterium]